MTKGFLNALRSFVKSESGMTLPMLGVAAVTLVGAAGLAIDVARQQLVQSRLSYALDAAGLAASATLNTADLNVELNKYMAVNFPADYLGSSAATVSSQINDDKTVIDLMATTVVPTTFMDMFGVTSVTITATSQITRTSSGLELVMALDVTGSMDSGGKLTSMKTAAKSLVNILYGNKTTVPNLWIGLVPFSDTVNVGTGKLNSWIDKDDYGNLGYATTSWSGCVDAREAESGDVTDTPATAQKYKVFYWPSTDHRPSPYSPSDICNWWYGDCNVNDWVSTWYSNGKPKTLNSCVGSTCGPNLYCPPQMTPMTANKTTITNAIDALQADGNTHINLGAIWAWNMLSPRWRGTWGGEMDSNSLPLDYGTKHMNKAAILLTDGDNTMSKTVYTAYGYLSDGRLGSTTDTNIAKQNLNTKLSAVCTAMKQKGIYVYVIALGGTSDINSTTRALLKGCASSGSYYFESPTSSQLQGVFNAIADSLSNLRVSE